MDATFVARLAVCAFFSILFLQSGIDKVVDWKGNLEWLTGHFSNTPFRGIVPLLLAGVTFVELGAGIVSGIGLVWIALGRGPDWAIAGLALATTALTMLFAGQRIAKDYAGAATLATYYAVALLGLVLMK